MRNINLANAPKEPKVRLQKVLSPQEHIDAIIEKTFEVLNAIKNNDNTESRLIFPKYRSKKTRYSEQELRFLFVEQFQLYCGLSENQECKDWFYSVETPTEYKYVFSENGEKEENPHKAKEGEKGQSAQVDLVIHAKDKSPIALIEFKAHNTTPFKLKKDFVKLKEEPKDRLKYFVMYIDKVGANTISNLRNKVENDLKGSKILFFCYDINTGQRVDSQILEKKD